MSSSDFGLRVAERIRRARKASGLSQQYIAETLGISQAAVSNIESGTRSLRLEELATLSHLLDEEIGYFLEPLRSDRRVSVGVTLRATVADLGLPDVRDAVNRFLDLIESEPLPEPSIEIKSKSPEKAAAELRAKSQGDRVPVDERMAALALGVGVFTHPLPDALSGFLVRDGERALIGVNANHARTRKRFSVAHELGHCVLHHEDGHFLDFGPASLEGEPPDYDPDDERAANQFAAEFLMPEALVRRDAKTLSLPRLASRYKVSQEAMSFRLANLNL